MLPSILAKQLETGLGAYIETTFPMTNAPFRGSIQRLLETKDAVYHEPYVAVKLPFRVAETMPDCFEAIHPEFLPYVHQQNAFDRLTGEDGRSTLIATGTGSGKTECFLYPILEYCYQHRGEPGIKALIIYPMNALASDQARRIAELIHGSPELRGNVTAGMYVGGGDGHGSRMMTEDSVITDKETMLNNPPDILLTNYKMLDYLLVRPHDAALWNGNRPETLRYIAVDELHTFDGAQGTDLACLLRRLKSRLYTPPGYLCCIGTSATMGSKENSGSILEYASQIFGEHFDADAVVTEDRLSPVEFFADSEVTDFTMPAREQVEQLADLIARDQEKEYLELAVQSWLEPEESDIFSDEGRIQLGKRLMHHSFLQAVIGLMGGKYYQTAGIIEQLQPAFPALQECGDPETAIDALFALISHARTGVPGHLRAFLNVQVQLWIRELARLVAKVSGDEVTYALADDLNAQQKKQYLPVQNCRDCGATAWVSRPDARGNAAITDLRGFYNAYFQHDDLIMTMYPYDGEEVPYGMAKGTLCPNCLQVKLGEDGGSCSNCGGDTINVLISTIPMTSGRGKHKTFKCPFCGSRHGISLMGLRSATEISASLSQMFASKFNDDKKSLAFSDNVQDAAQRAGFFNSRTWKSGFRGAVQQYVQNGGAGKNLQEFCQGFLAYWHEKMSDEDFVSFFIGPNMTWMDPYTEMLEKRSLGHHSAAMKLMRDIEKRIAYEIMLEYGLTGRVGRTLEKSGCSVMAFDSEELYAVADHVYERTVNELGDMPSTRPENFRQMVLGYVNLMRRNGAFDDPAFAGFIKEGGKDYMLSNDHIKWLPGKRGGRNIPRFLSVQKEFAQKIWGFDTPNSPKYKNWIASCCMEPLIEPSTFVRVGEIILEELAKENIVVQIPGPLGSQVYGLNKEKVYISSQVVQLQCDHCGAMQSVAAENLAFWKDAPCFRSVCGGVQVPNDEQELDYYGKLFSTGDLVRVNAREHTGLLERNDRETLEENFKRKKKDARLWDPNVLSCTPTLEMGIDIGDLSSVILCSMPPAQAQFQQRTGRAGRKDGNALTLAVANAKPHDLYFYADPLDMMEGNVAPPKIFLKASAVLERQFVAYCMDCWVKQGIAETAVSPNVGACLRNLDLRREDQFPYNFLYYVQKRKTTLIDTFLRMFPGELDENAEQELKVFANGQGIKESPLSIHILTAFREMKEQKDSLQSSVEQMRDMIKELERKPKDASYDAEIADIKHDMAGLIKVIQGIQGKNIFGFLSDEGLLPNYAFPESGVMLKAILYRQEDDEDSRKKPKTEKSVYEYTRAASAAISEFAPNNHFYVQGHKLKINQIDLSTREVEKWRLCPNCSFAQRNSEVTSLASCPRCGSTGWADSGQVRDMLKVQMVYSNMKAEDSQINDDSESRAVTFYCKQMLVDVDEEHDITSAYRMDNDEFVFGYEFARKAVLREINFGESDVTGEPMMVSGVEEIRKGFQVCKYCGKIKEEKGIKHLAYCKTKKDPKLLDDALEDCLFLYREFQTEVLRILIPASNNANYAVKTQSFTAAFMLGMKEYFGNVEHLRATVTEVPVLGQEYRKQYLVVYDSVPGGTGYLKQLMHNENALIEVFEKALAVLENCSCKEDPQKDGCYHCLYAYRQSQNIGDISRKEAIHLLRSILSGKDSVEKIDKIGSIPVNSLFDSELEQQFIAGFEQMGNENRKISIAKQMLNSKEGYILKVNDNTWEIEPQVSMGTADGVAVPCKPDFVIRPLGNVDKLPVAVFTDGFAYHKDKAADDTLKREAIRRSGNYRVWSLSWHDVQQAFQEQSDFATDTLNPTKMPCGGKMFQPMVRADKAERLKTSGSGAFELLICYLDSEYTKDMFKAHAKAYAASILDPMARKSPQAFSVWSGVMDDIAEQTWFTDEKFKAGDTMFGIWTPRDSYVHFRAYAGFSVSAKKVKPDTPIAVAAVLEDRAEQMTDKFQLEWNGFWHFCNVMQFIDPFVAVSASGIEQMAYAGLNTRSDSHTPQASEADVFETQDDSWNDVLDEYMDEETINFAEKAKSVGIAAPDEAGYELVDAKGAVLATIELAWCADKIGFMTEDQTEYQECAEKEGWKIFVSGEDLDATLFGGEN